MGKGRSSNRHSRGRGTGEPLSRDVEASMTGPLRKADANLLFRLWSTLGLLPFWLFLALAAVLTGCAPVRVLTVPLPPTTLWGYTAESVSATRELVIVTEGRECDNARAAYVKLASTPVRATECRPLDLVPGWDFWIVPAIYVHGYLGAQAREECQAMERRQSRDFAGPTRMCQPVGVEFK